MNSVPETYRDRALAFFIFFLGGIVYLNSLPGNFYIDDVHLVAENPLVHSIDLRTIFTTDYWGPGVNKSGLFRPLTILSFALNKLLFGPEAWSYHLVNVFLHALVGLVLFHLLRRWGISIDRAFFTAALFAAHPIHTEVLNIVVGRSELLVAFFFLLALNFAAKDKPMHLAASGLCFLLALLSKEHAITFLAALLLSDLFFQRKIKARLPFYAVLLLITAAWLIYRQFGLEYGPEDPFKNSSQINAIYQPLALMTTPVRVLTALKIQILFFGKQLLPLNLQAVYSGPAISTPVTTLLSGWGLLICLSGIGLTVLTAHGWLQHRHYGLAIPLYVACFSVTANIFFVSGVVMAERSAYLPSVWFCLAIVSVVPAPERLRVFNQRAVWTMLMLLVAAGAIATWTRNFDFRDPVRLWAKDFERDSRNTIAGTYLIDAFVQKSEYGKAVKTGNKILTHHPDLPESLEMQAWLLVRDGRPDEALILAEQALRQMADEPSEKLLTTLVEINVILGRPAEVLKWLDRQDLSVRVGYYWELKGNAYAELGSYRQAVESYRRIGEPPPGSEVPFRLEQLLQKLGEHDEAAKARQWIQTRESQFDKEQK